jgi:hypothetical protein
MYHKNRGRQGEQMSYQFLCLFSMALVTAPCLSQDRTLADTNQRGSRVDSLQTIVAGNAMMKRDEPDSEAVAQKLSDLKMELQKIREANKTLAKQIELLTVPQRSSMKIGILAQAYGQALQEQTTAVQDTTRSFTQHWQRQLFVRRMRVLLGGELSTNTSFFVESDATNIGKVDASCTKPTKVSMYIQDAYIQQTFMRELSVIAGLQLVGITRNSLQSATSLMALDYGSYQYLTSTAFDNTAGRDVGLNLRGFLFDERLEYRAGVFSGKNFNLYSPLRTVVRLSYMAEDREKGFFYTGTTLGKGKILTVGGGLDLQSSYQSYSLDVFADLPLFQAGSITASGSWTYLNGGGSESDSTFFTGAIPRQAVIFSEVGYYFKEYGIQPYLKYETQLVNAEFPRQVNATASTLDLENKLRSKQRLGIGVNYFLNGHNASAKVLYELVSRWRNSLVPGQVESITTGEATLQLQVFVY